MKIRLLFFVPFGLLILSCNTKKSLHKEGKVKFYVDSAYSNSKDPLIGMAYGINILPPWPDGGSVFVNLPEHLEYMPETQGIARHQDNRTNVWKINADSTEAGYYVESLTEPGVFLSVKAKAINQRASFEVTITNRTEKMFKSIISLFCFQYKNLKGFSGYMADNFSHTYIILNGKLVSVASLVVKDTSARARMAQVHGCIDEYPLVHNEWAEKMGGFIEKRIDAAYTILTSSHDDRKIIVHWTPGKSFLSNRAIPCIHADPCWGDLVPRKSITVYGELIFARAPLEQIMNEFPIK